MSVVRLGSGVPYEAVVGYSRVVVHGDMAWVSGTTSTVDGAVAHPGDAYAQTDCNSFEAGARPRISR